MTATIRRLGQPGDLGWLVMAHGESYAADVDWDTDFESLVLRIVAEFDAQHDPDREAAWIAELDGRRVGCVMLRAGDTAGTGVLRVLLVDSTARGHGLGRRLVRTCLDFAVVAGYRRVTLWTNDVLVAARQIYQGAGFELVEEEPHRSFGHDLVGQRWALDLDRAQPGTAGATGD